MFQNQSFIYFQIPGIRWHCCSYQVQIVQVVCVIKKNRKMISLENGNGEKRCGENIIYIFLLYLLYRKKETGGKKQKQTNK